MIRNKEAAMRDFILNCSESLFTMHGYKNTSMDMIAEKCEISKPTLYNYFASKNSLFMGLYGRFQNEISKKSMELMNQDKNKYQIIEEIIDLSLSLIEEKRNFLRMMVREHHVAIQECDNIEEHIQFELRRREEVSRRLGEFMKEIVRPEVLQEFGIVLVGTTLSNLLEGAFWDSIISDLISHEKRKKMIIKLLKNGILA
ncbi:MAG: TetR/AcrR family transcriptional regulator [Candidatus Aminicenantes bacterium]|nr:TetR/AcrR family transcriptional regulator [Candidatus Aminicenantes bacterium]